jgi:Transcriptional regulator containing PAS, AAA-type ATPase, and DNA-binding domains
MEIGIITYTKTMSEVFKGQLESIFGESLKINTYSLESGDAYDFSSDDAFRVVVLPSTYFQKFIGFIPPDCPFLHASLTFCRDGLSQLRALPGGTKALLVNINTRVAMETITTLYQNGILNIDFLAFAPGDPVPDDISIAVTPGEAQIVPEQIAKVIDIGNRCIDIHSIIDIAIQAGCEHLLDGQKFENYCRYVFGKNENVTDRILKYNKLHQEFETLMHMLDIGILGADETDTIYASNIKSSQLFGVAREELIDKSAHSFISKHLFERCRSEQLPIKAKILGAAQVELDLTLTPLTKDGKYIGCFIMAIPTGEDETIRRHLMRKFLPKGHRAKYTFDDIVGNSDAIHKTIEIAKRMAKTDSSVLITGESGTGKELLAHAIHQYSDREDAPFMAINCGAIPDALMESELFGYEDGSFTGAKKGGKIGLLEVANHGTVFFDEIENMSPALQIKLLRFMQEREIMRVGGSTLIPLNVRIISATNKDLLHKVRDGTFREDLYYRIGTLPIEVPPLRVRAGDIFVIFEHIRTSLGMKFSLSENAKEKLLRYNWLGNIRELHNCVEYLSCHQVALIEEHHLPKYLLAEIPEQFYSFEEALIRKIALILGVRTCGRRKILDALADDASIDPTEAQIRSAMEKMREKGWLEVLGGRSGCALTPLGKKHLLKTGIMETTRSF